MAETYKFMKWDGRCLADPTANDATHWQNQDQLGEVPKGAIEELFQAVAAPAGAPGAGAAVAVQRAHVNIINVDKYFAPIEQYMVIELRFKLFAKIGCLVVQIHDADGELVYAERLTKPMLSQLPDSRIAIEGLQPPLAGAAGPLDDAHLLERHQRKWAHPAATPYTVTVWVSDSICQNAESAVQIPLDVAAETDPGAVRFIEKHKDANPGGVAPEGPLETNQTSVRLTGDLETVLVPWTDVFTRLTGKRLPDDPAALSPDEKVLWAKCRLNALGFGAGPVNTQADEPDYVKAVKRYGAMRAIGGVVNYRLGDGGSIVENKGQFDDLTGGQFDSLVEHLVRERELAAAMTPISQPDQLGDGGADPLKVYIDGNHYPIDSSKRNKFEAEQDAKQGVLTRPSIPMRTKVHVFGRGDRPFDVPEVLEPLFFLWTWSSIAADPNRLPDPDQIGPIAEYGGGTYAEAGAFGLGAAEVSDQYQIAAHRSKARKYVQLAHDRVVANVVGGYEAAHYAASYHVGGVISATSARNQQVVFVANALDPTRHQVRFTTRSDTEMEHFLAPYGCVGDMASPANPGAVAVPGGQVYFQPSLIAGDHYRLTAELAWKQQRTPACPDIGADDERLSRLNTLNPPAAGPRFQGSTRILEAWRRLRVAKFIQWGTQTNRWDDQPLNRDAVWETVKREYAMAYIELPPGPPPVALAQSLNLAAGNYEDAGTKKLKHSGLCIAHGSFSDAVTALLPLTDRARMGRTQTAPCQFDPNFMIPPIQVKDLSIAAGTLPNVSAIIDAILMPLLNRFDEVRGGTMPATDLARFEAAWLLLNDWSSYSSEYVDGAANLKRALHYAGGYLLGVLQQGLTYTAGAPGAAGTFASHDWTGDVGLAGDSIAIDDMFLDHDHINTQYGHEDFAELMDLMFLPDMDGSIRHEQISWVRGDSRSATRTIGLHKLIEPCLGDDATNPLVGDDSQWFTHWAFKRYNLAFYQFAVDEAAGEFADWPLEYRNLYLTEVEPARFEARLHNVYATNSMNLIGDKFPIYVDQVVRKGLLCETNAANQYKDFADGMIVISVRAYPQLTIAGQPCDEIMASSLGLSLGVAFVSHRTMLEPYALWAHEIGHVLYLMHDRNASTMHGSGFLFDHDHGDQNCMMSYPQIMAPKLTQLPPPTDAPAADINTLTRFINEHIGGWLDTPDGTAATLRNTGQWRNRRSSARYIGNFETHTPAPIYRPHFCGKCNLRLRGWDIWAQIAETNDPPDLAPPPPPPAAMADGGGGPEAPMAPAPPPMAPPMAPPMGRAMGRAMGGAMGGAMAGAAPAVWDDPVNAPHPDLLPISSGLPLHQQERVLRQYAGHLVYPVPGERITIQQGESLCDLALDFGHRSCLPIWSHPENAALASGITPGTTVVYVPRRAEGDVRQQVQRLHFIRGGNAAEVDVPHLNVSNYKATQGGVNGDQAFPDTTVFAYDANGHADEDAFQLELVLPNIPDGVAIPGKLEALRPTYDGGGVLNGHQQFPDDQRADRSLAIQFQPYAASPNGADRLRFHYARLVALKEAKELLPEQTLLVSDYAAVDAAVEPLDQDVRARVTPPGCGGPSDGKCAIERIVSLERARKTIDIAIHILRAAPNGTTADDGVTSQQSVLDNMQTATRNIYAQAHVKFNVVITRTVDPPSEMLTIDDEGANVTTADGTARVTIVTDAGSQVITADVVNGSTPMQTATALATAINDARIAGVTANAGENPPIASVGRRSADVYFTGASRVTLQGIQSADAAQPIDRASLAAKDQNGGRYAENIRANCVMVDNRETHYHIGSREMRMLTRALDSGGRNLDVIVVEKMQGTYSQACPNGYAMGDFSACAATHRPAAFVANTILADREAFQRNEFPKATYLPHEFGHVLIATGQHVIGEYPGEPDTLVHALMWREPGNRAHLHHTIDEGDGADNWTTMRLRPDGRWYFQDAASPGHERRDAVRLILAHALAY